MCIRLLKRIKGAAEEFNKKISSNLLNFYYKLIRSASLGNDVIKVIIYSCRKIFAILINK